MSGYEWDNSYSVGIPTIDEQHRKLFAIIGRVHEAFAGRKEREALTTLLPELQKYTVYHFSAEEHLMRAYEYPGLAEHQAEHKRFVDEMASRVLDLQAGKAAQSLMLISFLGGWIVKHIGYSDQAYSRHLHEKDPRRFPQARS
jgi:hemerythrin